MPSLKMAGTTADFARGGAPGVVSPPMTIAVLINPRVSPGSTACIGGLIDASAFNNSYLLRITSGDRFRLTVRDNSDLHIDVSNAMTYGAWGWGIARITSAISAEAIWNGDFANKGSSATAKSVVSGSIDRVSWGKRDNTANDQPYDGMIHAVAIWDAALSDDEITAINAGIHPSRIQRASLVHLWDRMADGSVIRDLAGDVNLTVSGSSIDGDAPNRDPFAAYSTAQASFGVTTRKLLMRVSNGDAWASAAEINFPSRPFTFSGVHDTASGEIKITLDNGETATVSVPTANDQDGDLIVGAGLDAGSIVDETTNELGVSAVTLSGQVPTPDDEERSQLQHAEWLAPVVSGTTATLSTSSIVDVNLSSQVQDKGQGWAVVAVSAQNGLVTPSILSSTTVRLSSATVSGADVVVCSVRNSNPRPITRFLNISVTVDGVLFDNGYGYEKTILASQQNTVSGLILGSVVRLVITDNDLRVTGSGGKVQNANGYDIRFESEDGAKLSHHIRSYDGATGTLDFNIRIPSWSPGDESYPIRMFYGNSTITTTLEDVTGVWGGWLAVWDCQTGQDFSGNGRNLTPSNIGSGTLIGDAGDFNGSTSVGVLSDANFLSGLNGLTVSGWLKADSVGTDKGIVSQGIISGPDNNHGLIIRHDTEAFHSGVPNTYMVQYQSQGGAQPRSEFGADTQSVEEQYIAAVIEPGQVPALYLDGQFLTATYSTRDATFQNIALPEGGLYLGAGPKDSAAGGWAGLLDEFRLRADALPQQFIDAEYLSELRRTTWYGISGENTPDSDRKPVAATVYLETEEGLAVSTDVLGRSFDPDGSGEVSGGVALPPPTIEIDVTPSNIVSALLNAPAGAYIQTDDGFYDNLDLTANNGTPTNKIYIIPKVRAAPATFRGRTELFGTGIAIIGQIFDNRSVSATKALRFNSPYQEIGYCDFYLSQAGIMLESGDPSHCHIHDCGFNGQALSVSNGGEVIKPGWQRSYDVDIDLLIERCRFRDCNAESELISIKAKGVTIQDCDIDNSSNIWCRHGQDASIQRVRMNGDIVSFGTDHNIGNVVCREVEINKGTHDGDIYRVGAGSEYLSSKRCVVRNITGDLHIGKEPFGGSWNFNATNCSYHNISGSFDNDGVNTTIAPALSVEAPPNYSASDVGVAAYQSGTSSSLTVTAVGSPSDGNSSFSGPTVTYTPDASFVGDDSFTYTIENENAQTDIGNIYVNVRGLPSSGEFETSDGLWQANAYAEFPEQVRDLVMVDAHSTGYMTQARIDANININGGGPGSWNPGDNPVRPYRRLEMRDSAAERLNRDGRPAFRHKVALLDTVHDIKCMMPTNPENLGREFVLPYQIDFSQHNCVWLRWHMWADNWRGIRGGGKRCTLGLGRSNRKALGGTNGPISSTDSFGSTNGVAFSAQSPFISGDKSGFGSLVNHETDLNNSTWLTFGESKTTNGRAYALNRWVTIDQIIKVNSAGQANGFWRLVTDNSHVDVLRTGVKFCNNPVSEMKAISYEVRMMHGGNPNQADEKPIRSYNEDCGGFFLFKGNWVE